MEESYTTGLPTSHLAGSVPAVTAGEKSTTKQDAPLANMQTFPPSNAGGRRGQVYQPITAQTAESFEQQPTTNWQGVFSVSSYSQYFNVDTDVVVDRMICSLNPVRDDFFSKIDANPDLYGMVWISTTLVFILSSVGNLATYFSVKKANDWNFDVSYVHSAAWSIYGYVLVVPMAYHFYLQYMRSNSNLVRFWCLWGYSLTIFVLSSFLLLIPVGVLRWMIIIASGGASATFVALNLKSFIQENDLSMAVIAAFGLQIALAVFIKVRFFA
ncbi:uncharacterized protein LOC130968065 [Arachis stenosperma]|uniref:uncharacterized protein LOC130968065 n=1 Tax=Arachis stenosperma TaxID=217475 RepID=UPI0025AC82D0|nr:uncharacterized protein LOC130968065 [Arachis stenosperma]